mmetsp:Transcript_10180/g.11694  ORF Transcript_10180/g.11694 Transcript_10180/m.11694 type:complete len:80 (-) Transcript_10180:46-285(-)
MQIMYYQIFYAISGDTTSITFSLTLLTPIDPFLLARKLHTHGPFAESNRLIYLLPFHFLISLSNEIFNSYDTTIFSNGV